MLCSAQCMAGVPEGPPGLAAGGAALGRGCSLGFFIPNLLETTLPDSLALTSPPGPHTLPKSQSSGPLPSGR